MTLTGGCVVGTETGRVVSVKPSFQEVEKPSCTLCAILRRPGRLIVSRSKSRSGSRIWRSVEPEEVRRGDFVHVSGGAVYCEQEVEVTAPDHLLPYRYPEMARHWREELFA